MIEIKTLSMPKRCWTCRFFGTGIISQYVCKAMDRKEISTDPRAERASWCPLSEVRPTRVGFWKESHPEEPVLTSRTPLEMKRPEVTPIYVCGHCGGSDHMYGPMYPKRKVICDICGRINIYPWEKAHEQGSSFWEADDA